MKDPHRLAKFKDIIKNEITRISPLAKIAAEKIHMVDCDRADCEHYKESIYLLHHADIIQKQMDECIRIISKSNQNN